MWTSRRCLRAWHANRSAAAQRRQRGVISIHRIGDDWIITMARTRILEALGVDADERAATDAHEPIDQLPLPTLDERASIYLRAVHGDRDFTSAEHANARELILESMAADIAARDITTRDITTRDVTTRDALTRDIAARSDSHSPNAVLQELEPLTVTRLARNLANDLARAQDMDQSDDEPPDVASDVSKQSPAFSQYQRRSFFAEGRMLYGIAAMCSTAIFAAALGYWAGTARLAPDNSRLAVQVPPADRWSGQTPTGSDPRVVADAQRELASAFNNVAPLGPADVAILLERGQELIARGRVRLARMVLEQAAEAKSAPAALALGQTYDPLIERSSARPDAPPDIVMARTWYEK